MDARRTRADAVSVFDLFRVGIGPSSSHTVGPMRAARAFAGDLAASGRLSTVARVRATLLGSLAWTGVGHATDRAVLLGLAGCAPETLEPDEAARIVRDAATSRTLKLAGRHLIPFDPAEDIVLDRHAPAVHHPNTMLFAAYDEAGAALSAEEWLSPGGGFILQPGDAGPVAEMVALPHPYATATELLDAARTAGLPIHALVRANEEARRSPAEVDARLDGIAGEMFACIERGLASTGELPGGLRVRRRARAMAEALRAGPGNRRAPHEAMEWVSAHAIAVNEENAAGGRVVTAPTNGAAGVVPAVLRYYRDDCPGADMAGMRAFLLAAGAVGGLFKARASISGAEVGCQGEVGVACSMAAAGLATALGGSNEQVENAAEIGMEHHLGMTCDPIGGLVQIPCIERNAFGAAKAISAASLALRGDGTHHVSLDQVIDTMRRTGADMLAKYKETSQGGLAVSHAEC